MDRRRGQSLHTKRRRKTPDIKTACKAPRDWDKAISAAYLRLLGATQETAAKQVGTTIRAICRWEGSDWWPQAVAEGRHRWLQSGDSSCMRALVTDMNRKDDATTARWWADRRIPEFAPPKQRVTHSGDKENPLEVKVAVRDEVASRIDRLVASIEATGVDSVKE